MDNNDFTTGLENDGPGCVQHPRFPWLTYLDVVRVRTASRHNKVATDRYIPQQAKQSEVDNNVHTNQFPEAEQTHHDNRPDFHIPADIDNDVFTRVDAGLMNDGPGCEQHPSFLWLTYLDVVRVRTASRYNQTAMGEYILQMG